MCLSSLIEEDENDPIGQNIEKMTGITKISAASEGRTCFFHFFFAKLFYLI